MTIQADESDRPMSLTNCFPSTSGDGMTSRNPPWIQLAPQQMEMNNNNGNNHTKIERTLFGHHALYYHSPRDGSDWMIVTGGLWNRDGHTSNQIIEQSTNSQDDDTWNGQYLIYDDPDVVPDYLPLWALNITHAESTQEEQWIQLDQWQRPMTNNANVTLCPIEPGIDATNGHHSNTNTSNTPADQSDPWGRADLWTSPKAQMCLPRSRQGHLSAIVNDYLYIFGGSLMLMKEDSDMNLSHNDPRTFHRDPHVYRIALDLVLYGDKDYNNNNNSNTDVNTTAPAPMAWTQILPRRIFPMSQRGNPLRGGLWTPLRNNAAPIQADFDVSYTVDPLPQLIAYGGPNQLDGVNILALFSYDFTEDAWSLFLQNQNVVYFEESSYQTILIGDRLYIISSHDTSNNGSGDDGYNYYVTRDQTELSWLVVHLSERAVTANYMNGGSSVENNWLISASQSLIGYPDQVGRQAVVSSLNQPTGNYIPSDSSVNDINQGGFDSFATADDTIDSASDDAAAATDANASNKDMSFSLDTIIAVGGDRPLSAYWIESSQEQWFGTELDVYPVMVSDVMAYVSGPALDRTSHTTVLVPTSGRMYVFGGSTTSSLDALNTWSLNVGTSQQECGLVLAQDPVNVLGLGSNYLYYNNDLPYAWDDSYNPDPPTKRVNTHIVMSVFALFWILVAALCLAGKPSSRTQHRRQRALLVQEESLENVSTTGTTNSAASSTIAGCDTVNVEPTTTTTSSAHPHSFWSRWWPLRRRYRSTLIRRQRQGSIIMDDSHGLGLVVDGEYASSLELTEHISSSSSSDQDPTLDVLATSTSLSMSSSQQQHSDDRHQWNRHDDHHSMKEEHTDAVAIESSFVMA